MRGNNVRHAHETTKQLARCMCTCARLCVCVCVHVYACMCLCILVHMRTRVCAGVRVRMCVRAHLRGSFAAGRSNTLERLDQRLHAACRHYTCRATLSTL